MPYESSQVCLILLPPPIEPLCCFKDPRYHAPTCVSALHNSAVSKHQKGSVDPSVPRKSMYLTLASPRSHQTVCQVSGSRRQPSPRKLLNWVRKKYFLGQVSSKTLGTHTTKISILNIYRREGCTDTSLPVGVFSMPLPVSTKPHLKILRGCALSSSLYRNR